MKRLNSQNDDSWQLLNEVPLALRWYQSGYHVRRNNVHGKGEELRLQLVLFIGQINGAEKKRVTSLLQYRHAGNSEKLCFKLEMVYSS